MQERGLEDIHFNESFSKSFILAEKFRKAEVVGEKTQEQNNVANVKVEEILSTSFPIHYQSEEQYNSIPQYKSVIEMVAVSNDSGKTEDVQNRAKNALFEIGLALSQNTKILKAATEGSDELNKILPSNLYEIQPYILSVILTEGKDDVQGQELVTDLVELFKMKKKAEVIHGKAQVDYEEKKDSFLDKLYDKSQETVDEAVLGRVETMMGYVLGIDNKKNNKRNINTNETNTVDENGDVVFAMPDSQTILPDVDNTPSSIGGRKPDRLAHLDSPKKEDFIRNLIFGQDTGLDSRNYPSWIKEMDHDKQYLMHIMSELAKFSSLKSNAPFDRLLEARPTLLKKEIELVYECPGVRFALQKVIKESFELVSEKSENKAKFLHLRYTKAVKEHIYNLDDYIKEISEEILKNKVDGITDPDDAKMAAATAVNFLITSDVVESADYKKEIKPTRARVDKMNAMYHPFAKFCSKVGITRPTDWTGKEEFDFGGKLSSWAYRRMEDTNFKEKVKQSFENDEGEYRIFPQRMAASFVDLYEVKIKGTGEKVSMAEALMKDKKIDFQSGDNLNVMNDYKDMFEGVYKSFLLMTDKGDKLKVSSPQMALAEALALVRQVPIPGTNGKQELGFTNDPDFFAFTFGNWYGLNDSKNLVLKWDSGLYVDLLNRLLNTDRLISDESIKIKVREKLHGLSGIIKSGIEDQIRVSATNEDGKNERRRSKGNY